MQESFSEIDVSYVAALVALCCALWSIFAISLRSRRPRSIMNGVVSVSAAAVWLLFIFYVTLFCREPLDERRFTTQLFGQICTAFYNDNVKNEKLLNVVLFVPLGLFVSFALPKHFRVKGMTAIVMSGTASGLIELAQYKYRLGMADVDDVLCNMSGGLVGYVFYVTAYFAAFVYIKLKVTYTNVLCSDFSMRKIYNSEGNNAKLNIDQ